MTPLLSTAALIANHEGSAEQTDVKTHEWQVFSVITDLILNVVWLYIQVITTRKYKLKSGRVTHSQNWITVEGDDTKALSLQHRNQSTFELIDQNETKCLFIYPVFYLLNGPDW